MPFVLLAVSPACESREKTQDEPDPYVEYSTLIVGQADSVLSLVRSVDLYYFRSASDRHFADSIVAVSQAIANLASRLRHPTPLPPSGFEYGHTVLIESLDAVSTATSWFAGSIMTLDLFRRSGERGAYEGLRNIDDKKTALNQATDRYRLARKHLADMLSYHGVHLPEPVPFP